MANILLAEDDDSMLNFLVIALERVGHDVIAQKDGMHALEVIKKGEIKIDLLLTDIVMPGLDGIELAQKATDLNPDLKVMFITGFAAMTMTKNDLDEQKKAAHVLSKPFHLNKLVEQVEKILAA